MNPSFRKRLISTGIAWLLYPAFTHATPLSDATSPVLADNQRPAEGVQRTINIAKAELAKKLGADASTFKIINTQQHTWPDSSLGCARPGQMASQVITPGYIVTIATDKGTHQVHATETTAAVCDHNIPLRNPHNIGAPLKNIDAMITRAREDLAARLNTPAATIRTLTFVPANWPDTSMQCSIDGETIEQKITKGYRIALRHGERTYVYHTDMDRVRACPAIETN